MGIYDREYYRGEKAGLLGSLTATGMVCKWLILLNVIVFILQLLSINAADPVSAALLLDTSKVLEGEVWRLVTYAFLHDPYALFHIVFNMLFLWWFGSELESMYGPREFLALYLAGVLAGGLLFTAYSAALGITGRCLGASAGVTAITVVYACHFPNRIILLFFVLPIPIWLLVVIQVATDAFYFSHPRFETTTAVAAHLGGALVGFLHYWRGWRFSSWFSEWGRRTRARTQPALKIYQGDDEQILAAPPLPVAPAADLDEQLEAKLDAVLEKVARSGQGSLTESERQILFRASEIYKKRRSEV